MNNNINFIKEENDVVEEINSMTLEQCAKLDAIGRGFFSMRLISYDYFHKTNTLPIMLEKLNTPLKKEMLVIITNDKQITAKTEFIKGNINQSLLNLSNISNIKFEEIKYVRHMQNSKIAEKKNFQYRIENRKYKLCENEYVLIQ